MKIVTIKPSLFNIEWNIGKCRWCNDPILFYRHICNNCINKEIEKINKLR